MKQTLDTITLQSTRAVYDGTALNYDLLLLEEVAKIPLPAVAKRTRCLFFALCVKGKAECCVDTIRHTVNEGDIIIIPAGQVMESFQLSPDCSGIAIVISEEYFQEAVAGIRELSSIFVFSRTHPVFHLDEEQVACVRQYFDLLKARTADPRNHFRRDTARSLMQALIYEIGNVVWHSQLAIEPPQTRSDFIFAEFIRLVEAHYREERRVGWYAQQLAISPKYLSECVGAASRRTPNEWIDNYVVMELRVQLKNTHKSIKEITELMHFPNQSFMGKFFKEHTGLTPSAYRKGEQLAAD